MEPGDTGCSEGTRRCGGLSVYACTGGEYVAVQTCAEACENGTCVSACGGDPKSYLGCDFVALDLDNTSIEFNGSSAAAQPWAVTVSNPGTAPVTVEVRTVDDVLAGGPSTIEPGAVTVFRMPRADIDGTGISRNAFRIKTTGPVTAHQFNPENNVDVYSNDASLLLPERALGNHYRVLGWPTEVQAIPIFGPRPLRSFVAIATVGRASARVTLTAPARVAIAAGPGFDQLAAGETREVSLNAGEVLNLEPVDVDRADLTGMEITATVPIAVFAGSECADIPIGNVYCDHIEEQLTPVESWGDELVMGKFQPRGREPDLYRVMAAQDGTVVTTTPPQAGAASTTLNAGQFVEFLSTEDFVVHASGPVLGAQFMVGSGYPGPAEGCVRDDPNGDVSQCTILGDERCIGGSGLGDPASLLTVPSRQFRTDYIVLTPRAYFENYLTLIAPEGIQVMLDGAPVPLGNPIPGEPWWVSRVPVTEGAHNLSATQPFGVYAYGYECDVSYAYSGGQNLEGAR